jgi:hemerythrin-like domain-containing protein
MLTNFGKPPAPEDAVALLLECHGRIRSFLDLARRLGAAQDVPADVVADAAGRLHRYFSLALPLHARDEEESVLPRIAGREPDLDRELEAMRREHAEHQEPLRRLLGASVVLASSPSRLTDLAPAFVEAARDLSGHFEVHLAREESVIFPAARRLLGPAADAEIVAEIRARRT